MSVVIALLLFALAAYAIWRWVTPQRLPAWREKRLYWIILGAVVLVWFLGLIGVFGAPVSGGPRDPLLNR